MEGQNTRDLYASFAKMPPEIFADLFQADRNMFSHRYSLIWCAANQELGSDWRLAVPLVRPPSAKKDSGAPSVEAPSPPRTVTGTTKARNLLTWFNICSADAHGFPDITMSAPRKHKNIFHGTNPRVFC